MARDPLLYPEDAQRLFFRQVVIPYLCTTCLTRFLPTCNKAAVILCSHDVVARINEENFTGDSASMRTAQEERCVANLALFNIAA